jgi:hypothetical protein
MNNVNADNILFIATLIIDDGIGVIFSLINVKVPASSRAQGIWIMDLSTNIADCGTANSEAINNEVNLDS